MGILTPLWLVPLIAVVVLSAALVLIRRKSMMVPARSARRRYWRSVVVMCGIATVVRVGICWSLTYRAFVHRESLSEVPLIGLLLPEYLVIPGDPSTPTGMWALTGALVVGSLVMVSAWAVMVWRLVGRDLAGRAA